MSDDTDESGDEEFTTKVSHRLRHEEKGGDPSSFSSSGFRRRSSSGMAHSDADSSNFESKAPTPAEPVPVKYDVYDSDY
jgi:hypothetical protein